MQIGQLPTAERGALKAKVKEAIAAHLQRVGPRDWRVVIEHPEWAKYFQSASGQRRFKKWVKEVREPVPMDKTRPHEGRSAAETHQQWSKETAKAFLKEGSTLATPRMVTRYGRTLPDLEQHVDQQVADALALRLHATSPNHRCLLGFQIDDPKLFKDAHGMMDKALERRAQLQSQMLEMEDRAKVYEQLEHLIDTVLSAHPDLQRQMREGLLAVVSGDAPYPPAAK